MYDTHIEKTIFAELRKCFVVGALFLLISPLAQGAPIAFQETTNRIEQLEVTQRGVRLHIPDVGATFQVADRVPLIQQTDKMYIVAIQRFSGAYQLAAFPREKSRREGSGWVTNEKFLIFASNTRSTSGHLELQQGERLTLIDKHQNHYEAVLKRFGREVVVRIPDGMGGLAKVIKEEVIRTPIEYVEAPQRPQVERERPSRTARKSSRPARKISVTFDETGIVIADEDGNELAEDNVIDAGAANTMQAARIQFGGTPKKTEEQTKSSQAKEQVIQELREVVMMELAAELQRSNQSAAPPQAHGDSNGLHEVATVAGDSPLHSSATSNELTQGSSQEGSLSPAQNDRLTAQMETRVSDLSNALEGATERAAAAAVGAHAEYAETSPSVLKFFTNYALMFQILLGVCVLEAVLLFNMRLKSKSNEKAGGVEDTNQVYSYNYDGEPMVSDGGFSEEPAEGDLTGSLEGYSMGQVVQFFNSSGDSGLLTLRGVSGQIDLISFQDGQIIDAQCGEVTGEEAVYAILRCQHGTFTFNRKDLSSKERVILQDTMSLLLEGHRLVDEMGFTEG